MFKAVLIANRGEIACRIIRSARALGMRSIAVYSDADRNARHVRLADEAHWIGPAPARDSYLVAERILEVARRADADCIHPGYGFLSENAEFADACAAAGIAFIGPPASAMRAMGLKDAAKALVEKAGVPVVPGYHGDDQDPERLRAEAERVGFPVLIKAVAGGGGKGMRRVEHAADFAEGLASARREAANAFGNDAVLVERYVTAPRHVEIQVFGDTHGNVVHLFERDCSLQRRHQKVIEEAPAPGMSAQVRTAMGKAAVEAARAVGYVGAGTVEFIADGSQGLRPDGFFFMEMNTRLQVEHPVTEAITGLDLVQLQFRVAAGEALPFKQENLEISGHAVEARLYAEDPESGFLPSTGRLHHLELGGVDGVRIDSGVSAGDVVTPFYDPMIAKLIVHRATRLEALDALADALAAALVIGPKTNRAFLEALCRSEGFRQGRFDTGYIDRNLEALGAGKQPLDGRSIAIGAAALARLDGGHPSAETRDAWSQQDAFTLVSSRWPPRTLLVDGEELAIELSLERRGRIRIPSLGLDVTLDDMGSGSTAVMPVGREVYVRREGRVTRIAWPDPLDVDVDAGEGGGSLVKAPMHGKLIAVMVKAGEAVARGQKLAIVEAMKMEHALTSPRDGVVAEVSVEPGSQVAEGARILSLAEEAG